MPTTAQRCTPCTRVTEAANVSVSARHACEGGGCTCPGNHGDPTPPPAPRFCLPCANARTDRFGDPVERIPGHQCDGGVGCDCIASHPVERERAVALLASMPRYEGRGCSWTGTDPTRCTVHGDELVLVPAPHSVEGQAANLRVCRTALAQAAAVPTPEPPRPTVVDQLAQRMDTNGLVRRGRSWGTASHDEAARRALAALPCLDDATVDALAAVTLFSDHPFHPGEGDWESVPPSVQRRWRLRIRVLLDELAKAADQ